MVLWCLCVCVCLLSFSHVHCGAHYSCIYTHVYTDTVERYDIKSTCIYVKNEVRYYCSTSTEMKGTCTYMYFKVTPRETERDRERERENIERITLLD